mmetsp:Transcript_17407/g.24179  ORF Transcript_17407/g.24179 Transcript_17407/m.24179 type:complete len:103 (-) Transcript_17407:815-1123(-)
MNNPTVQGSIMTAPWLCNEVYKSKKTTDKNPQPTKAMNGPSLVWGALASAIVIRKGRTDIVIQNCLPVKDAKFAATTISVTMNTHELPSQLLVKFPFQNLPL